MAVASIGQRALRGKCQRKGKDCKGQLEEQENWVTVEEGTWREHRVILASPGDRSPCSTQCPSALSEMLTFKERVDWRGEAGVRGSHDTRLHQESGQLGMNL